MHSPACSIISDVEVAPARVVSTLRGNRIDARVYGMGDGLNVRRAVRVVPARVLFAGAAKVGQDDLAEVLESKGKLTSKWADSLDDEVNVGDDMEVSDDDASLMGESLGRLGRYDGTWRDRFDLNEAMLDRVAKMVKMLVAAGGLLSPATRLAVEKHTWKMAREWDESVSQASERARAEIMMKAAERRVRRKAEEETRAEEARVVQEKPVQIKEAARLAAATERDRMVEAARECANGPAMVAASEKVVEAARVVRALEREVEQSAVPVEIGGWQVAGGCKRKTIQVVSQLACPVDGERRKSLQGDVTKVQGLGVAANLG